MKKTMNLVALLLCVLCAFCIAGCDAASTEDSSSNDSTSKVPEYAFEIITSSGKSAIKVESNDLVSRMSAATSPTYDGAKKGTVKYIDTNLMNSISDIYFCYEKGSSDRRSEGYFSMTQNGNGSSPYYFSIHEVSSNPKIALGDASFFKSTGITWNFICYYKGNVVLKASINN